ncbi:helix-turn-helix domain-containing protein [Streptomyces sp. NPDC001410]|uniref:helix-turn-helix domain-containing protein n=1 Tax=Streptomyces sp. NPDC001410 TaxID=3364574 RepID=UPI0036762521
MSARRIDQPTARQVRLGSILRKLREDGRRGTQDAAARSLGWVPAKLNRIETGRVGVSERDLNQLFSLYGVTDEGLRTYVLDLRARGNVRGWDSDIRSVVSAVYADYIGYESDAVEAYNAETNLIPGLLQTHAYAGAVLDMHLPDISEEERCERLAIRDKRQEVFKRPNPLIFWGVVSESAFEHVVGGPDVMVEQLEHLLNLSKEYPHTVNLYVLPKQSPWHAVMCGSFMILSFQRSWEPDIVYLDGLTSNRFLEEEWEVATYSRLFRRLTMEGSYRGPKSLAIIQYYLNEHRKGR